MGHRQIAPPCPFRHLANGGGRAVCGVGRPEISAPPSPANRRAQKLGEGIGSRWASHRDCGPPPLGADLGTLRRPPELPTIRAVSQPHIDSSWKDPKASADGQAVADQAQGRTMGKADRQPTSSTSGPELPAPPTARKDPRRPARRPPRRRSGPPSTRCSRLPMSNALRNLRKCGSGPQRMRAHRGGRGLTAENRCGRCGHCGKSGPANIRSHPPGCGGASTPPIGRPLDHQAKGCRFVLASALCDPAQREESPATAPKRGPASGR
jgi:hypothetical protein